MKWTGLLLIGALALPGCAAIKAVQEVNVTQTQVYQLKAGYATISTGMREYRLLPWCSTNPAPCQKGSVSRQMQKADASAVAAIQQVDAVSKLGDQPALTKAYAVAQAAISTGQTLVAQYGGGN